MFATDTETPSSVESWLQLATKPFKYVGTRELRRLSSLFGTEEDVMQEVYLQSMNQVELPLMVLPGGRRGLRRIRTS